MAKQELIEGLRIGISKGESLQQAMMSLFNAGYSRGDIEDAARALYSRQPTESQEKVSQSTQKPSTSKIQKTPKTTSDDKKPAEIQATTKENQKKPSKVVQRVSKYEDGLDKKRNILTIVLIILLIVLFGALIGIFLFSESIRALFGLS